jgi:soluble lytic murein transglycosylase-like protein
MSSTFTVHSLNRRTGSTYLDLAGARPTVKLMRIFLALTFGLACLAHGAVARADIFAYTDRAGVTHYSNVPSDARYVRILEEPAAPAAAALQAAPSTDWRQRAALYASLIDAAARGASVHPALLRAVISVESAYDPRAVSRAGAQGLMQLQPATARRYGVVNSFDPAENLRGGAHYLSDLLKRYKNNLELALAAYNAGEDAVDRYGGHVPPYRETREYVPAVLKLYAKLRTETTRAT